MWQTASGMIAAGGIDERWYRLTARPLRSLRAGRSARAAPGIVIVPGLGALGYLLPTVRTCARWTDVELLDVPGFGHRRTGRCAAGLVDVARTVAEWLRFHASSPVVVVGHSTGAQAALRAAVLEPSHVRAVVLGGPTFPPEARRWWPLAGLALRTVPHESAGEIPATVPEYLRGRWRVVRLLRTSMRDTPERLITALRRPVLVLRGHHDAVSPACWGARLADAATDGRLVTVPGAHNFCFTHPGAASAVIRAFVEALPEGGKVIGTGRYRKEPSMSGRSRQDGPPANGESVDPQGPPYFGEHLCPDCGGSGTVEGERCATCGGSGKVHEPIGGE